MMVHMRELPRDPKFRKEGSAEPRSLRRRHLAGLGELDSGRHGAIPLGFATGLIVAYLPSDGQISRSK